MKKNKALFLVAFAALVLVGSQAGATDLSVTPGAAFGGSNFGLQIDLTSPINNAFVQDNTPGDMGGLTTYWCQFSIRQLTTMANASAHSVFRTRKAGGPVFQAQIVRQGNGDYVLWPLVYKDDGNIIPGNAVFIEPQGLITFEWQAATADGADDGVFRMWKGSNMRFEITNIDNDTHAIIQAQMGSFGGIDATSSGQIHFDNFVSSLASLVP